MSKWSEFLNECRSYTIAPAGFGKTHAIVDCVEELSLTIKSPVLILTHTHAGVASIKKKLSTRNISKSFYQIETITSFAQRYVMSFLLDTSILPQQEDDVYFPRILELSITIFKSPTVRNIIRLSYSQLIVDEYQDCTFIQHQIIDNIADVIPTHIFGDPLQGIFGFKGDRMVDMEKDLVKYHHFELLDTPWRWRINDNSLKLGEKIMTIRKSLLAGDGITLIDDSKSHFWVRYRSCEMTEYDADYFKLIRNIISYLKSDSLLIIVPMYINETGIQHGTIYDRVTLKSRIDFEHNFTLIEAIDDSSYYKNAQTIDCLQCVIQRARKKTSKIQSTLIELGFKSGDIKQWFGDNTVKKRKGKHNVSSERLSSLIFDYSISPTLSGFVNIIDFFTKECHYRCKRPDLLFSLLQCCHEASVTGLTVLKCMHDLKNKVRRKGRKIEGNCIGTTLLTKGLEFDDVIILDAHRLIDRKNFYVAISRACKRLVILTKSIQLFE